MKRIDPFDGYTINVFLDDDGEYLAHFVELPNVSALGGRRKTLCANYRPLGKA